MDELGFMMVLFRHCMVANYVMIKLDLKFCFYFWTNKFYKFLGGNPVMMPQTGI